MVPLLPFCINSALTGRLICAISCSPVCSPETVLAYVADCQVSQQGSREPRQVFAFDQLDEVAELAIHHMDAVFFKN